jgi:hypothetical protein
MRTVDLQLLRELLAPYEASMDFKWTSLPKDDVKQRDELFHLFRHRGSAFPDDLLEALHAILTVSTSNGARALQEIAEQEGVRLAEEDPQSEGDDNMRLTTRHLALIAYLRHRDIFRRAMHRQAFFAPSPLRLVGARRGVAPLHTHPEARKAFEAACSTFFSQRYQGRICELHWYPEGTRINVLIEHGVNAVVLPVEEQGQLAARPIRVITQDTICFEPSSGLIKVNARSHVERRRLVELFAEHLLHDPAIFAGAGCDQLYTLGPIETAGAGWEFENDWDDNLTKVAVTCVEINEGKHGKPGRAGSPWTMSVSDNVNAVRRLFDLCPDLDLATLRVAHVKMRMRFEIKGERRELTVSVKVPNGVSFRDHMFEARIFEHLRCNGFVHDARTGDPAPAAA